ncbi:MAG: Asp-tRNA(Asn)/Glu-tRNA(Gln) amidotransferase subunit GatC [Cyclobacteriaceae bacterium]|nr:Asp-tRNA(Asn)/Glu-tRNA(Gln) amidotransferase subunit GatC [Cyclobacteriaceae bacterium]
MNIDRNTLDKIAHLARLTFEEKDAEEMMKDMSRMVSFVEKLKEVNTEGVEPLTTMSHEVNALRDDVPAAPLEHERALRNAPQHDSDYFRVPKVLE